MQTRLPAPLVRKMQAAFFHLSDDGVLMYDDPMIGRLENRARGLSVRANAARLAFELHLPGGGVRSIPFGADIAESCRQAFCAYFTAFDHLCRSAVREAAA